MATADVYPYGQSTFWRKIRNDSAENTFCETNHTFFDYIICFFFVFVLFVFVSNRSLRCTFRNG